MHIIKIMRKNKKYSFRYVGIKRNAIDAKFFVAIVAQLNFCILPFCPEYDMVQVCSCNTVIARVAPLYPLIDMYPRMRRQHLHISNKVTFQGKTPWSNLIGLGVLNGKDTKLKTIQTPRDESTHVLRQ